MSANIMKRAAEAAMLEYDRKAERRRLRDVIDTVFSDEDIRRAAGVIVALLDDESPDVRRKAANDILDRNLGKPRQSSSVELSNAISGYDDSEIEEMAIERLVSAGRVQRVNN